MAQEDRVETETHHNQRLTQGAEAQGKRKGGGRHGRKVVAFQLDERQYAAFRYLGGAEGLKALLCPPGLCIHCREKSSRPGTYLDSLCEACQQRRG